MNKLKHFSIRIIILFASVFLMFGFHSTTSEAASLSSKNAVKQIIIDKLLNCDKTTANIYSYRITPTELTQIYNEIAASEYSLLIESYDYNLTLNKINKGLYVQYLYFSGMNEDALVLYPKLVQEYNRILSGVETSMSDLDKLMYFHDQIIEKVVYLNTGNNHVYGSNGALAEGVAVCMGYADSLMLLLKSQGIDCYYVREKQTYNHGWVYVKIDGEWYHVDPTWDDTRSNISGATSRQYLLCNDAEFATTGKLYHGNYTWEIVGGTATSASTRFSNWFAHKVVGQMQYSDGYWYYYNKSKNRITRCKADGSCSATAFDGYGMDTLELISVDSEYITCKIGENEVLISKATKQIVTSNDESECEDTLVSTTVNEALPEKAPILAGNTIYDFETSPAPSNIDLSDFSDWKSGYYDTATGLYNKSSKRLCLIDKCEVEAGTEFTYTTTDTDIHMVVCELNSNNTVICSLTVSAGQTFTISTGTTKLAISLQIPSLGKNASYSSYTEAFGSDFEIGLTQN